jgi:hypothetical protein
VPFSTWLGVVLLFFIFGAIVLVLIGPMPRHDDYEAKRAKTRLEKLKAQREEDAKALTTYGWIDKTKGVARIPIERAMELTIAELAHKQPALAYPIATPAPQASPSPAVSGSPTPAPPASPTPTGTPQATSISGPKSEAAGQPAAAINPPPAPARLPRASPSPSPTKSP